MEVYNNLWENNIINILNISLYNICLWDIVNWHVEFSLLVEELYVIHLMENDS